MWILLFSRKIFVRGLSLVQYHYSRAASLLPAWHKQSISPADPGSKAIWIYRSSPSSLCKPCPFLPSSPTGHSQCSPFIFLLCTHALSSHSFTRGGWTGPVVLELTSWQRSMDRREPSLAGSPWSITTPGLTLGVASPLSWWIKQAALVSQWKRRMHCM